MQVADPLNLVFGFLVKVLVAGGGLALIVYQVFKHLSVKWLDSKFEERLQALRHKQGKEIEELRFKIATMLDRTTKLHQREFDVLPEAWSKISEAYWSAGGLVASLRFYPDFPRLKDSEQEDLINKCSLQDSEKQRLRDEDDPRERTKIYQECLDWKDLIKAEERAMEAAVYLAKNGIFISNPLNEKFEAVRALIWRTLVEKRMNDEHKKGYGWEMMHEESMKFIKEGDRLLKELEVLVHDRLWSTESGIGVPDPRVEPADVPAGTAI